MRSLESIKKERESRFRDKVVDFGELDSRFIEAFEKGIRVEVEWKDGFEDYTGYGNRTNGKKARFNVGISNGWKPCFLSIFTKRSLGDPIHNAQTIPLQTHPHTLLPTHNLPDIPSSHCLQKYNTAINP